MLGRSAAESPQTSALVAQGIEHRPPEPGAQVRILPGAPAVTSTNGLVKPYLFVPPESPDDRDFPLLGGGAGEEIRGADLRAEPFA
jgi:hypothetical protein